MHELEKKVAFLPVAGVDLDEEKYLALESDCKDMSLYLNRHHSQHMWKSFVLSQYTLGRNFKQVMMELNVKLTGLRELKKEVTNLVWDLETSNAVSEESRDRNWAIENTNKKDRVLDARRSYEASVKDIAILGDLYQRLKTQLTDKYGKLDEGIFEEEETEYWIKRLVAQGLRDVRCTGNISKGNQEALEQLGLAPAPLAILMRQYLQTEAVLDDFSTKKLEKFLSECAENFKQVVTDSFKRKGFPEVPVYTYLSLAENPTK